jgi:hypothetical protein
MARVVVKIRKNISEYSYGYTTVNNDNITWSDSNIIDINASGEFFIYLKNKRTGLVEKKQKIFIMCLGDVPICNINIAPFVNTSICPITVSPVFKLSSNLTVCNINIAPIRNIRVCNIEHKIIKLD